MDRLRIAALVAVVVAVAAGGIYGWVLIRPVISIADLGIESGTLHASGRMRNTGTRDLVLTDALGERALASGSEGDYRVRADGTLTLTVADHPEARRTLAVRTRPATAAPPLDLPPLGPLIDGRREYTLRVEDERIDLGDPVGVDAWTYERGRFGGPVLRARWGETLVVRLDNASALAHSLHPHIYTMSGGLHISPGTTATAAYLPLPREGSTPLAIWYHCETAPQLLHLAHGMFGLFAIEPKGLSPADREIALNAYVFIDEDGDERVLLNGRTDAYLDRPIELRAGSRLRLWLMNHGQGGPGAPAATNALPAPLVLRVEGLRLERIDGVAAGDTVEHDSEGTTLRPQAGGGMVLEASAPGPGSYLITAGGRYAGRGGVARIVVR